jgi:CRISPR-associated endonuclease/helicase Cas3
MKQGLLEAFAKGLGQAGLRADETAYPLVTSWPPCGRAGLVQTAVGTRADVQRRVQVHSTEQIDEVHGAIDRALSEGRCVCWVRNTVADAMAAFTHFRSRRPAEELLLFHARFTLHDRLAMEERVLATFGKRSTPAQRAGKLLIATQVVEQSLDVDFDLLVTDLAPIDRIIQRAGRLRRHRRSVDGTPLADPAAADQRGEPWLWVLTPPWTDRPDARWFKAALPKAAAVYPHHGQLWLTARALRAGAITMPGDARVLIEGVFGPDADIPPGLDANALAAVGQGFAAQAQAQMNSLALSVGYRRVGFDWWADAKAPSRLGDASSTVTLARWVDGRLLPWVERPHGWAYSSLRVADRLAATTAPAADPADQTVLDATLAELPAAGRWTVLLPLKHTSHGWVGEAMAAPRGNQQPRRLAWRYDTDLGLRVHEPQAMPDFQEDPEA